MLIHSFINLFAGGRSESKAILFVLYIIVLLIFLCIRRAPKRRFIVPAIITTSALYVLGAVMHIWYAHSVGLSANTFFTIARDSFLSSSSFAHIHIGKGAIGHVLSLFGITPHNVDAGLAYVGTLPAGVFWLYTLLLLVAIFSTLLIFLGPVKQLIAKKSLRVGAVIVFGYAILSFSLIKTAIDGGIATAAAWIGLLVLALFLLRERGQSLIRYYFCTIFFAGIFLVFGFFSALSHTLLLSGIAALLLLYSLLLQASEPRIRRVLFLGTLFLFLGAWWQASIRDRAIVSYLQIPLHTGDTFYSYELTSGTIVKRTLSSETTIKALVAQAKVNASYVPITVEWKTCIPSAPEQTVAAVVITDTPLLQDRFLSHPELSIAVGASKEIKGKWHTDTTFLIDRCTPQTLNVIDRYMNDAGYRSYLLVQPTFYVDSLPL